MEEFDTIQNTAPGYRITPTNLSLVINWDAQPLDIIKTLRITCSETLVSQDVDPNMTSTTFDSLTAGTFYHFSIQAINHDDIIMPVTELSHYAGATGDLIISGFQDDPSYNGVYTSTTPAFVSYLIDSITYDAYLMYTKIDLTDHAISSLDLNFGNNCYIFHTGEDSFGIYYCQVYRKSDNWTSGPPVMTGYSTWFAWETSDIDHVTFITIP